MPAALARAAVVINEVAWMGTSASASCEWVELLNTGAEPVSLSGWTLTIANEGAAPKVVGLSGSISATGYYVVARNTASCLLAEPTESANLQASFGSGISNTATTLTLGGGSGTTDIVDASGGWGDVGGLNDSDNKLTAQRHSNGWITAAATPGAANSTEEYVVSNTSDDDEENSSHTATSNPGYVTAPLPQVFADAGGDRTTIVGADTKFVATAYDRDQDVINYAKFFWNFGDGVTAEGPWVLHHYSYPGRYAVELTITNTSLRTSSRITVTAMPASVALSLLPQGGASIKNNSGRDLDLSLWVVKQGEDVFVLPEYSTMLSGSSINVSAATLGFAATNAKLYYPDGTEAVSLAPTAEPVAAPAESIPTETPNSPLISPTVYIEEPEAQTLASSTPEVSEAPAATELAASAAASEATLPLWTALAGLSGIVGLGVASVWARQRKPVTPPAEEEFTIE